MEKASGLAHGPFPGWMEQTLPKRSVFPSRPVNYDHQLLNGRLGHVQQGTKNRPPILIGIVLGPLVEENYIRALRIAAGDPMVLFSSDLGNILWAFLFISITLPYLIAYLKRRKARLKAASD